MSVCIIVQVLTEEKTSQEQLMKTLDSLQRQQDDSNGGCPIILWCGEEGIKLKLESSEGVVDIIQTKAPFFDDIKTSLSLIQDRLDKVSVILHCTTEIVFKLSFLSFMNEKVDEYEVAESSLSILTCEGIRFFPHSKTHDLQNGIHFKYYGRTYTDRAVHTFAPTLCLISKYLLYEMMSRDQTMDGISLLLPASKNLGHFWFSFIAGFYFRVSIWKIDVSCEIDANLNKDSIHSPSLTSNEEHIHYDLPDNFNEFYDYVYDRDWPYGISQPLYNRRPPVSLCTKSILANKDLSITGTTSITVPTKDLPAITETTTVLLTNRDLSTIGTTNVPTKDLSINNAEDLPIIETTSIKPQAISVPTSTSQVSHRTSSEDSSVSTSNVSTAVLTEDSSNDKVLATTIDSTTVSTSSEDSSVSTSNVSTAVLTGDSSNDKVLATTIDSTTVSTSTEDSSNVPATTSSTAVLSSTDVIWREGFGGINMSSEPASVFDLEAISSYYGVKVIRVGAVADAQDLNYLVDSQAKSSQDDTQHLLLVIPRLRRTIIRIGNYGLKVIVTATDLPGAPFQTKSCEEFFKSDSIRLRGAHFWGQIAKHLRDLSDIVLGYDLINEPYAPDDGVYLDQVSLEYSPQLHHFYIEALKEIRLYDPQVKVILNPLAYSSPLAIDSVPVLSEDPNIVYSFHMYATPQLTLRTFRSNNEVVSYPGPVRKWTHCPYDFVNINYDFLYKLLHDSVRRWQLENNIPSNRILVGEFGISREVQGAGNYLQDLVKIFDEFGWSWCLFSFRDEEWDAMDYELGNNLENMLYRSPTELFMSVARYFH